MKIVNILESTRPISSDIRNAYIDFSKMTLSLVAVVTDVIRDGQPGDRLRLQLQRPLRPGRADPRALRAAPAGGRSGVAARRHRREPRSAPDLGAHDDQREAGRPRRALGRGRHDRHGGLGRGRQDRGQAALPAARRTLRRRQRRIRACSSTPPAATTTRARTSTACARDGELPRARLHGREDEDRRRAARRGLRAHRGGAEDPRAGPAARRRRQRPLRPRRPRSRTRARCRSTRCSGTRRPAIRSTTSCRRSSPRSTPARWRPARTCSRCRTRAT